MAEADRARWDERYRAFPDPGEPSRLVPSCARWLPSRGRALDVAGGAGRHALWLAARGLEVTLTDISPVGLEVARRSAAARGLALTALELDLEQSPLPAGPWDVVLAFHYLQRELWPRLVASLAPGGVLVLVQPTLKNLERHDKPRAPHLLAEAELAAWAAGQPLEVLALDEGWLEEGRHEARLVARVVLSPCS